MLNMIFRKIFKVKTVGSRKTGDLRPEWSGNLPPGTSMVVHEYDEAEGWCICECWVSNHPSRTVPRSMVDLVELAKETCVIEVLPTHPLSPPIIGRLTVARNEHVESVNEQAKTLRRKGIEMSFKRKRKRMTTQGVEEEQFVLDEG